MPHFETDTVASAPPRGPLSTLHTHTTKRCPLTLHSFDFKISNLYNFSLSGCFFFQTLEELLSGIGLLHPN